MSTDDAPGDLIEVSVSTVPLRWRDTDKLGHVNHAVFFAYMEEARDAWMIRRLGRREVYIIVRIEIDFLNELSLDAMEVTVHTRLEALGTKSIRTQEEISANGVVVARARTTTVRYDMPSGKTQELTDTERELLSLPASVDNPS